MLHEAQPSCFHVQEAWPRWALLNMWKTQLAICLFMRLGYSFSLIKKWGHLTALILIQIRFSYLFPINIRCRQTALLLLVDVANVVKQQHSLLISSHWWTIVAAVVLSFTEPHFATSTLSQFLVSQLIFRYVKTILLPIFHHWLIFWLFVSHIFSFLISF